jgi:hypothetical protein
MRYAVNNSRSYWGSEHVMISIRDIFRTLAVILVLSGTGDSAEACSIPVFRYAGVYWPADGYRVRIMHDGPMSESDGLVIESLRAMSEQPAAPNISVETFDMQGDTPDDIREAWRKLGQPSRPHLILQYPASFLFGAVIWEGPLTPGAVAKLVDSPARRAAAERLIDGDVAVWLMLDGTDADRNEQVAKLLEGELAKLADTLSIPEQVDGTFGLTEDDPVMSPDFELSFSVLRVAPDDPAEEVFISMLMHSEYDLPEYAGRPMVFPLYGRGRALYALIDAGITDRTIAAAGEFLTGACSCQVKALNPGVDMLMAADWEIMTEGITIEAPPIPLTSISGLSATGYEGTAGETPESADVADTGSALRQGASGISREPNEDDSTDSDSRDGFGSPLRTLLVTLGSLSAVIMVLTIVVIRRRSNR